MCANRLTIKKDDLEEAVLGALRSRLLDPNLSRRFCAMYVERINRRQSEQGANAENADAELGRVDRSIAKLVDAIANGVDLEIVKPKLVSLQARKAELEAAARVMSRTPVFLMPNMSEHYHREVQLLIEHLSDPAKKVLSAERLRALIDKIVLTPRDGKKLEVTLHGKLAGILRLAAGMDPIERNGALSLDAQAELEQINLAIGGDGAGDQPCSRNNGNLAAPASRIQGGHRSPRGGARGGSAVRHDRRSCA